MDGKEPGSFWKSRLVREIIVYGASAVVSCGIIFVGLRLIDPNRINVRKAQEIKKQIEKRLGRPLGQTNEYEVSQLVESLFSFLFSYVVRKQDVIANDVVNPDHIDVGFGSIGGLENIKKYLDELVILPLKRPELFASGKLLRPQRGVLLYGPPGTGKTMLAKAIAKESGAVFINVRVSNLMSKWFGDAQKLGMQFLILIPNQFILLFIVVVLDN